MHNTRAKHLHLLGRMGHALRLPAGRCQTCDGCSNTSNRRLLQKLMGVLLRAGVPPGPGLAGLPEGGWRPALSRASRWLLACAQRKSRSE
eukprot:8402732-Pyramimonas_sp.AAC.1